MVVGYDGSYAAAAAIERAIDRASPDGRVIVVHAWQPPAVLRGSELYPVVATAFCSAAEAVLERVAAEHPRLADVSWESRLLEAPPAKAIADVAKAERADEVVVGTRGAGRMHALLGGTALGILHRASARSRSFQSA